MENNPFFKPLGEMVPKLGRVSRPKSSEAAPVEADAPPPAAPAEEKPKPKTAKLSNPKWEAEKVGFNEETPISVDVELPPEIAHKKKVAFELFAKTPKGPERISQGDAMAEDGKATLKIPVYIPNYRDEDGNLMRTVEYYFVARHSEADPLDASKSPKQVDEMADRVLEMHILQNITFATGKSFIRTSEAGDLKALGQAVKEWKGKHADGKLAVFGHADAVGEELGNKKLSERRAKSVQAYLAKDAKPWEDLYGEEKWGLAAVQELLKHLGHDPGVIDGQDGPKTQSAVKDFQGKKGLGATGTADPKTREALFLAYFESNGSPASAAKDFDAIDGKAFTGCSEFNLIEKTEGACEPNRRVAVLLLKVSKNFPIHYPCKQGAILPCQKQAGLKGERKTPGFRCRFYDNLVVEKKGGGGGGTTGKIKAFVHSTEKDLKRVVNLKGKPDLGPEYALEVEVEAGVKKVFWKAVAGAKNSKRNDPIPGFIDPASKKTVPLKEGVGEIESDVKEGKAKATFHLGIAGGDEFTFEVGAEKGKKELEQKVTTARKVWTQITLEKGMALPALTNFINAYDLAAVEVVRTKDVEFEKKDAPARTFYPEWMMSPGGADKEAAVVGSHNKSHFQGLLKDVEGESPKAHMVICQHQFDEGDAGKTVNETLTTRTSTTLDAKVSIFKPALRGNLVISGTWKSLAPAGHADHGKSGSITDADIIIEKSRASLTEFKVKLPAAAPEPSASNKVKIEIVFQGVNGPFLGESDGKQILAVYDPADPTDFQNTLTHEMGHAYNQTPGSGKQSPGLGAHPHHYIEHGGIGPHCSTILKDGKEVKGVEVDGTDEKGNKIKVYSTGICVMFHSGPQPGCLNRYCDTCSPYVKAADFSGFGKG